MSSIPILAAGNMMDHLEPRYEWHWPFGMNVDLGSWNHWVADTIGLNPDITTHIVMMWFAAATCLLLFIPIARNYVDVPRGLRNFLEPILLYIRDEMTYPWFGEKEGRKFLPYLWTVFFFILACNLIGLLPQPFGITATGNFNITGALAFMTLAVGLGAGIMKKGFGGFFIGLVPGGVPWWLWPLILVIEVAGLFAKHFALMVRLFANMTAGHAILAVFGMWLTLVPLGFIPVRIIQATGSVAMVLFEIFIGLVQAYIFTTLSAIFISLAVAEEH